MSLIDNKQKISSYLEQGRRFRFLLAGLPSKLTAGDATELSLSPDEYDTSVGQAENYYYMERDAYVDAAPQSTGNTTHSKSNKSDHMPAGFSNVPKGDLPTQGNGGWRKTNFVNGDPNGASTSSNTSHTKPPVSGTKTPKKQAQKSHRNWWDLAWLKAHEHKS